MKGFQRRFLQRMRRLAPGLLARGVRACGAFALCALLAGTACGGDDEVCRFVAEADGSHVLVCPDGSRVRLPSTDREQPPGGIRGTVRRFAARDHAGIVVELAEPLRTTVTDEAGNYQFEQVPAGVHHLRFSTPGYEEASRRNAIVLPGSWHVEDADLLPGRKVLDGRDWQLLRSPREDRVLAIRNELRLLDPRTLAVLPLAERARQATFSADGSRVFFLEGQARGGSDETLALYEIDRGRKERVAQQVARWQQTPDGASLVYERRPGGPALLEVYHIPSSRHSVVAQDVIGWRLSGDGKTLLAVVSTPGTPTLVVWDLAAEGGTGLGNVLRTTREPPSFAPDGRSFVYPTDDGDFVLWDGKRNRTLLLDPALEGWHFSADADRLLTLASGRLVHHDLPILATFEIATGVTQTTLTADGEQVAFGRPAEAGGHEVVTWSLETRASVVRHRGFRTIGAMRFAPDGSRLFWLESDGSLSTTDGAATRVIAASAPAGLPLFHPNGDSFLFHEGDELRWQRLDGSETRALGSPVQGYAASWSPRGDHLVFLAHLFQNPGFGTLHLFTPEAGTVERLGDEAHLPTARFQGDGSLLLLRHFDRTGFRGELVRWTPGEAPPQVLGQAVPDGYRSSRDGRRVLFRTDGLPTRHAGMLALWDVAAGTLPVDEDVTDQTVGPDWIAWTTRRAASPSDEGGVYVSHWPASLPPVRDDRRDAGRQETNE